MSMSRPARLRVDPVDPHQLQVQLEGFPRLYLALSLVAVRELGGDQKGGPLPEGHGAQCHDETCKDGTLLALLRDAHLQRPGQGARVRIFQLLALASLHSL